MGGATTPSGTSSGTSEGTTSESQTQSGGTSAYSSSSGGQLVPVPWSLLKPASSGLSMNGEQSFTLNVEQSKLDQAPTLNQNRLNELGQPGWTQRINSYYGVSGESSSSSMGGAETPSGTMKGAGSSDLLNPNSSTNSNSTGSEQQ
jgi:hypothetical protein